ncbi:MAG: hypothetical protein ACXVZH_06095 [Terriglobales bacterium]
MEATKAACIRRDRGVGWLRRLAATLPRFFLEDWFLEGWTFLVEDCAAAGTAKGARSKHTKATIK